MEEDRARYPDEEDDVDGDKVEQMMDYKGTPTRIRTDTTYVGDEEVEERPASWRGIRWPVPAV
jgi:hypothetical protein